jgi:hypothetical protein
MQRVIVHGVPYFTNAANQLFTWESEGGTPQRIGTYFPADKSVSFESNHLQGLTGHLQVWRSKQHARPRKSQVSRGNTRNRSDSAEDLETNE